MPTIYLYRHGETEWSLNGRHTSYTDLDLTERGKEEAKLLGAKMKEIPFAQVLISPLKRAIQTAKGAGLEGKICEDLFEWHYGDYEGMTTTEIHQKDPSWNIFTHGAPGGESVEDIEARADRLIKQLKDVKGNIALFSSGHFSRALACRWIGSPLALGKRLTLATGSICTLGHDHDYRAILSWNSRSHYESPGGEHGQRVA